jgi:hypothetical protein
LLFLDIVDASWLILKITFNKEHIMTRHGCELELLAKGPVATLEYCKDCRAISVHMGAVTIRLDPEACESLWSTLSEALLALRSHESKLDLPGTRMISWLQGQA